MANNQALLQIVRNEPSFCFGTAGTRIAVTRTAGMMAPVTFFAESSRPVEPYYVAPWADGGCPPETISLLSVLRGDFFCAPFGGNKEPVDAVAYPPHGEVANAVWELEGLDQVEKKGVALHLAQRQKLRPGIIRKCVAVRERQSVVYLRHDLIGMSGPLSVGHHPCLWLPDSAGQAYLSFSPFRFAHTFVQPAENPANRGYSALKPDAVVRDLTRCPLATGGTTDLTRWPARRGFDDIVLVATKPAKPFAWTAFSVPSLGYVWFSLKNTDTLASSLLWMSNGGRHYPPWNGRNLNCIGMEEVTAFFHAGLAPSTRRNKLNKMGVATCLKLSARRPTSVCMIQGVARIRKEFTRVAAIEPAGPHAVVLTSAEGKSVKVAAEWSFVRDGAIDGLVAP